MIDQPSRSQLNCLRLCDGSMPCPSGTITIYSCNPSNNMSVVINRCTDDSCGSDDRPKEDTTAVSVCTDDNGFNTTRYCVFDNVDPEINGLQWIVDFVTGQVSWYKLIDLFLVLSYNIIMLMFMFIPAFLYYQ